ncbi:hypothetical protein Bca4012_101589 [Brassica carinata]
MVVYPAQTIYLSIVGCKLLQLMRKGFTWKLDQSMRIRIQVLLLEPSSLLCFRNRALWLYLQEVHGRRKRRCKGNDIKYPTYVHFWSNFQYKVDTVSLYAGARIMEKQHSIMIFKVFFAFTIAAAAISHSISLSPDSSKATNVAASCTQDQ